MVAGGLWCCGGRVCIRIKRSVRWEWLRISKRPRACFNQAHQHIYLTEAQQACPNATQQQRQQQQDDENLVFYHFVAWSWSFTLLKFTALLFHSYTHTHSNIISNGPPSTSNAASKPRHPSRPRSSRSSLCLPGSLGSSPATSPRATPSILFSQPNITPSLRPPPLLPQYTL